MKKTYGFFKKIKKFFLNLSNFKIIFIVYAVVTLLAACFLILPISIQNTPEGSKVDFLKALFTSASAFSDTGLTMLPTAYTWTEFGQAIIAILILLGGIGIFALKVYIVNIILGKWMSLNARNVLEKERGASTTYDLKKTIKVSITILFGMIIAATFVLMFIFYFSSGNFQTDLTNPRLNLNPQGNWAISFKYAVFHSISALNNAGFDIISRNSLEPYYSVYSIQIVFIVLLVIGGIGYPVIYDVYSFILSKIKRRTDFRFSLFTKVSCLTYLIVFLFGLGITLMFEMCSTNGIWNANNPSLGSKEDRMMAMIFHVFSTRNAGFSTTSMTNFTEASLILFSFMMFIGSAPSSTAGGIRTTTLAVILVAIWNKLRGVDDVRFFNKKIPRETVISSFLVLIISIIIVIMATFVSLTSVDTMWGTAPADSIGYVEIFFEISSAFGTTGLSAGLTEHLNIGSELFLIIVMFMGQLGISSTILVWKSSRNYKNEINYIEEDIAIG